MTNRPAADPSARDIDVFDRGAVRRHRDRAAPRFDDHRFLFDFAGHRLVERLGDVTRRFTRAADLGCRTGMLAGRLRQEAGIAEVIGVEAAPALASRARATGLAVAVAEEEMLPLAAACVDLVVSNLALHWVNDLPGTLLQVNRALRPDGLFLAAMLGGATLAELRQVLLEVELELCGGASPRISPVAEVRDMGGLLQRAGFALPVADTETVTVTYPSVLALIEDLRAMGETAAHRGRSPRILPRAFWPTVAERYAAGHADAEGRLTATFEILFLTGWRPHPDQQRPLRPGSAQARLADALEVEERPAGEKVLPGRAGTAPGGR